MRAKEGGVHVRRAEFLRVLKEVRGTGVHTELEQLLRPDAKNGRPRQLRVDVFLTAIIVSALYAKSALLVDVHYVLTEGLPYSLRVALGLDGKGTRGKLTVRQVRYLLEAIERRLAHTQGRVPDLDEADRDTRAVALQNIVNRLLQAAQGNTGQTPTTFAADATGIDSWGTGLGKGKKKVDPGADHAADGDGGPALGETGVGPQGDVDPNWPDPDAEWGYRTRTSTNPTKSVHGYHMLALVGVGDVGESPDARPKLTHALTLIPANANAVTATITMMDAFTASGADVKEILNDRDFSYKVPMSWAQPLRERGISQVLDMHDNDRGARDHNGLIMIDGWPHCPTTPEHLRKIPRPANLSPGTLKANATADQRAAHALRVQQLEDFRSAIAELRVYAFARNGKPDASGKAQFICPAQAGKLRCTNCPLSMAYPDDVPTVGNPPVVPALPDRPVKPTAATTRAAREQYKRDSREYRRQAAQLSCCRQRTVVIDGDVCANSRQDLRWGSDEWIASYSRRTHVEGFFGQLVGPSGISVHRGWTQVMGLVKTSLMLACAVVAANITALRSWADRIDDFTHPLCGHLPVSRGYEEIDDGEAGSPNAPPAAA